MALLVEFPVIRKGDFGDDPLDGTILKHNDGIEDAPFETNGRSDDDHSLRAGAGSRDLLKSVFTLLKKIRLKKQVPARVSRERQFGEKNDRNIVPDALFDQVDDLFRVEADIGDLHPGYGGCDSVKAKHRVFFLSFSSFSNSVINFLI